MPTSQVADGAQKECPSLLSGDQVLMSLTSSTSCLQSAVTMPRSIFFGKALLSPMVRINSLGFRLLCAERGGADVVFSEEVVAAKLCRCVREVVTYPSVPHSIAEYVVYEPFMNLFKRTVVFAVPARSESSFSDQVNPNASIVILQLGVCDPDIAAAAARLCAADVDGIDINMGCPKKFSVSNGFGAALMQKTRIAGAIVRAVWDAVNQPDERQRRSGRFVHVSFKTRLQSSAESTYVMLRDILVAASHRRSDNICTDTHDGISNSSALVASSIKPCAVIHAITLHARTREQRSSSAPLYGVAAAVCRMCRSDARFDGVCFVLNGSLQSRRHGMRMTEDGSFDAVMLARAALLDYSSFTTTHSGQASTSPGPGQTDEGSARITESAATDIREEGHNSSETAHYLEVFKQVLMYAVRYRTPFKNFKYHITRAFPEVSGLKHLMPRVQSALHSYADCYSFFGLTAEECATMTMCAHEVELFESIPHAIDDQHNTMKTTHTNSNTDGIKSPWASSTEGGAANVTLLLAPTADTENHHVKRYKRECGAT